MIGVEINLVVTDCLSALALYEKIFDIERVEVTDFSKGENEVIFSLYGTTFHMLDENPEFSLIAPQPDDPKSIWFNIMVPDINSTYDKAISEGCTEIQPMTELPDYGVSNAIFSCPFGHVWMLHQVHSEVSFEERNKLWEDREK